uniref:Peptidyl-tRNA hydrolase n=1 Tax=Fundidesulfovibrio putealis TaxID=270496 RepID=A0A7C4EJY5_9BACT
MPPHTLVAGLGNPGPKYRNTRHNFGFMAVDELALSGQARPLSLGKDGELAVLTLPGIQGEVLTLKPMTFMNLSGRAVAQAMRFYKIPADRLLVVHDELDLPLGRMRMKTGGGLAGHNGLKSIAAELGTQDFHRLRLGIGRPQGHMDVAAYVLQDFRAEEALVARKVLPAAAAAIRLFLSQGMACAMREAGAFDAQPPVSGA